MKYKNEYENNLKKMIKNHFDSLAKHRSSWVKRAKSFYKEDNRMMHEFIPAGSKVLEIGCGNGQLLSSLKTRKGVGIDISSKMINLAKDEHKNLNFLRADAEKTNFFEQTSDKFDFIVISDTIGYLFDIEATLKKLHRVCSSDTRLIVSYYSPHWEPFLNLAARVGIKMPELGKALLNENDISNLLKSSGFETVRKEKKIIFPFNLFGIGRVINKFIAPLPIFNFFSLRHYVVSRSLEVIDTDKLKSASIIIPCRNEFGNIGNALQRIPKFSNKIEVIFVEGHSEDGTWEELQRILKDKNFSKKGFNIKAIKQPGIGKADAVFSAFSIASNDVLMILDGDLTVAPEDLKKFWDKISTGEAEYINGTRLLYPMENEAMKFLNYLGNRFFSILFSWLLGQRYTDTLCGTKVITRKHYERACIRNKDLGAFDPFGDFFIIFGASRLNLKMLEMPIRYRARSYGDTQISRFSHGFLLIKMVIFAFFKLKAI